MEYKQLERCYKTVLSQRDKAECRVVELEHELSFMSNFILENTDTKYISDLYEWGKRVDKLLTPQKQR